MSALEVLAQLSVRDRMTDFRYFVGREQAAHSLIGCAVGITKRSAVWLHGPRRIGKSSLALYLARKAEEAGSSVVWVDAGDMAGDDFDGLLERAVARAPSNIQISGDSARSRFECLATHGSRSPVLLVLDEFDRIAVNLDTPRQAFLRRMKSENDLLCYLFVTRLDPSLIMEEVPDFNSRLSAICNHHRLRALSESDVRTLCDRVGADLGVPHFAAWANPIFRSVGGYSYAATSLVKEIAVEAQHRALDIAAVSEVLEHRRRDIELDLQLYWSDLRPGTRSLLLHGNVDGRDRTCLDDARADGYIAPGGTVIQPEWLMDVGVAVGLAPSQTSMTPQLSDMASIERIQALIHAINNHLQRRGHPSGFAGPGERLRYFLFTRAEVSSQTVGVAVDHLSRILIDGSQHLDKRRSRLPERLAESLEQAEGYQDLVALRGALVPSGAGLVLDGDASIARQSYLRLCAGSPPRTPDDWRVLQQRLLGNIIGVLAELESLARVGTLRGPVRILCQCADEDWSLLDQLDAHLAQLKRDVLIDVIDERQIEPGANREEQLLHQLQRAELILVLLSADFLGSAAYEQLLSIEAGDRRRDAGTIIPILLRPFDAGTPILKRFQVLPRNRKPVTSWENPDEAWAEIAGELRQLVTRMMGS